MVRKMLVVIWTLIVGACFGQKAAFEVVSKNDYAPAKVIFNNLSKKADSFVWDFGDGTQSQETNPHHLFLNSGRYTVTLSASKGKKTSLVKKDIFIKAPEDCLVLIQTSAGDMLAKLYRDTPKHQDNFLKLAGDGYYEGLIFHRVIKGFMIQTGDPNSRLAVKGKDLGSGGPGYTIQHEINDTLYHVKGALAAARLSDDTNPNKSSSGSQFYIVQGRPMTALEIENNGYEKGIAYTDKAQEILTKHGGAPALDQEYTVFGQIIDGLDIIDTIANSKTDQRDRPYEDIKILKMLLIK